MITSASLRQWCLRQPGATEEFPFGERTSVFKVAGRMFALSDLHARPLRLSLKCEPELAAELRATYGAIEPGYHLNKRHWNTVTLDGSIDDEMVWEMLEDSYDLVVAKLARVTRAALGWQPEQSGADFADAAG